MRNPAIQEIVDVLANPYIFGLPEEKNIPVNVRRSGEIFSSSLVSLRNQLQYPAMHTGKAGAGYIAARAFAALKPGGHSPVYGAVVRAGTGYDIYVYDQSGMGLMLVRKNVKLDGKTPVATRKNLMSSLRELPHTSGCDIFTVRVMISKDDFAKREQQLLSDGDIEVDVYG